MCVYVAATAADGGAGPRDGGGAAKGCASCGLCMCVQMDVCMSGWACACVPDDDDMMMVMRRRRRRMEIKATQRAGKKHAGSPSIAGIIIDGQGCGYVCGMCLFVSVCDACMEIRCGCWCFHFTAALHLLFCPAKPLDFILNVSLLPLNLFSSFLI